MTDEAGSSASPTPTRLDALARAVAQILPGLEAAASAHRELTCEVSADRLLTAATTFRDHPDLKFEMCMDVCGIDYLEHGRAEWKTQAATSSGFSRGVARRHAGSGQIGTAPRDPVGPPDPVGLPDPTGLPDPGGPPEPATPLPAPAAGRRFAVIYHLLSISRNQRIRLRVFCPDDVEPMVDSVTGIWASADWFEREAFDLFGILFKGHPDLRRLLTDYGFIGHPFRKDFPLSGNVEVRYDPEKGRVVYQPVTIEPRILVPKVIRHDNRYDPALTTAAPDGTPHA
jgi:NADH-quinone oxidoreductase subunit C